VHSKAGLYLSDATYHRLSQKARRDRLFLAAYEMVNECGDVVDSGGSLRGWPVQPEAPLHGNDDPDEGAWKQWPTNSDGWGCSSP
jgi:hypothetical protein